MAITKIASTNKQGTSSTLTTTGINTTGANLIVISSAFYRLVTEPTITDSKGNTWTPLTKYDGTDGLHVHALRFYYCANPTVGSGHTFTSSGGVCYPGISVIALSGAAASPADQQAGNANSATPGNITPSENNCIVITGITDSNNGSIATAINGGFTIADTPLTNNGVSFGTGLAYLIQTTAAAANPTWSSGTNQPGSHIASFKAAAATGNRRRRVLIAGAH